MSRPVYAVENFYNPRQFPLHTVTANEAATGNEAFRVGSGRRRADLNSWAPTTANSAAWVEVACDRVRGADFVAIDGHNLDGSTVRLQVSSDNFTTYTEVFSAVVPSNVTPNASLDGGARTEDGAYLRSFDLHAGTYWRLYVDAMGAGLLPRIAGLYLGLKFSPEHQVVVPFGYGLSERRPFSDTSPIDDWKRGSVHLKLSGDLEYDQARYHLEALFGRGRPMWLLADDEEADRALLVKRDGQVSLLKEGGDWFHFQARFDWMEEEPEVRA